jgi:hypothetical protein
VACGAGEGAAAVCSDGVDARVNGCCHETLAGFNLNSCACNAFVTVGIVCVVKSNVDHACLYSGKVFASLKFISVLCGLKALVFAGFDACVIVYECLAKTITHNGVRLQCLKRDL